MSKLQQALKQTQPPGVYRFASTAPDVFLRAEAGRVAWKLFVLNGTQIKDKPTFLEKIAKAMHFPSYFGKNWDALNDCLTDMEWERATGYVLLFQSPDRFIKTSPDDWKVAQEILRSAIQFWQEQKIPFYVLLRNSTTTDIPKL